MTSTRSFVAAMIALVCHGLFQHAGAGELAAIPDSELGRLLDEIKPQRGESPWREIPWLTNVTEARRRAVAEDRPIVIFTAADGSPLGRT
jgi:hypothetical protein